MGTTDCIGVVWSCRNHPAGNPAGEVCAENDQDKNWPEVVKLVTSYMERAETMFEKGADRKEWVMAMVKASADTVNYDLDMDKISDLIDSLCDMSKIVNGTSNTAR